MSLAELTTDNLRCLQHVEMVLHPGHNLIWGSNGAGKTSLLEAIFLLGRGRSFRTRLSEKLIRHGYPELVVVGRTAGDLGCTLGVRVSSSGGTQARIGGESAAALTALSQAFPVQVIDPGIHKLVEEGGVRRRRWLDWAVFHVEPGFGEDWLRYARALKQRNAALKRQPSQAPIWDLEVSRLGERVAAARRRVVEGLQPHWHRAMDVLADVDVDLGYWQGWSQESSLQQALTRSLPRDQASGTTNVGPHRGDILLRLRGKAARDTVSRGQQKLVAIAMTLAQLYLLQAATAAIPTLLLDDPAAELDSAHLAKFIGQVRGLDCQLILTALQPDLTGFGAADRVFHVEQGKVYSVL